MNNLVRLGGNSFLYKYGQHTICYNSFCRQYIFYYGDSVYYFSSLREFRFFIKNTLIGASINLAIEVKLLKESISNTIAKLVIKL